MAPLVPSDVAVSIPFAGDSLDITWTDTNMECAHVVGYHVYKRIDGGMQIRLTDTPTANLFYRDKEAPLAQGVTYYYQVSAVDNANAESALSTPPAVLENSDYGVFDFIIPEMIRRSQSILDWDGEPCAIFIRKRAGKRCHCFDYPTGQGEARCQDCYGTFYEGGYSRFDTTFRFVAVTRRIVLREDGLWSDDRPRMWMMTYPRINSDDLLLRNTTGERFWLKDMTPTVTRGILTRQAAALQGIPTGEIEYKVA